MRHIDPFSQGRNGAHRARRVLVAVDFGAPSLAAARWVARHVAPEAELILAHVLPVPDPPPFLREHLKTPGPFIRGVRGPMRGGLEGLAGTLGAARVRIEVRAGEPADVLASLAADHGVDLICVGRPRNRDDTVKLGRNTVDRLLRQVSVPVLQAAGPLDAAPAHVLAALDDGPASDAVLRLAWALTARFEARLTALHVLGDDVRAYVRAMEVASGAAAGAQAAEEAVWSVTARWLTTSLDAAGVRPGRAAAMVSHGDPGHEVIAACRRAGGDLLVLGRSGRQTAASAVGSTTRLALRAAPCPVLVVPAPRLAALAVGNAERTPRARRRAAAPAAPAAPPPVRAGPHAGERVPPVESAATRPDGDLPPAA